MRFLVDECCAPEIAAALRRQGHDVAYVAEDFPSLKDRDVLAWAAREKRIIVTEDKDFGELTVRRELPSAGVVLIRIEGDDKALRIAKLLEAVAAFGENLYSSLTIVRAGAARIRTLG